jgi:cob(I)alamin adenosyltransferase
MDIHTLKQERDRFKHDRGALAVRVEKLQDALIETMGALKEALSCIGIYKAHCEALEQTIGELREEVKTLSEENLERLTALETAQERLWIAENREVYPVT